MNQAGQHMPRYTIPRVAHCNGGGLAVNPAPDTGMRLHLGDAWKVAADAEPDTGGAVPAATLRRVGWLDQKGRVWTDIPPAAGFGGGSLTPLLIDPREDGR